MDCILPGSSVHSVHGFPGKSTGVGCHFLLQGIFPTQGLNPGLPHCRQMLYHLSHQGSPDTLPLLKNQTRNSLHNNIRVPPTMWSYFLICHTLLPNQLLVWFHPTPFIYSVPDTRKSVSICFAQSTQVTPVHTFTVRGQNPRPALVMRPPACHAWQLSLEDTHYFQHVPSSPNRPGIPEGRDLIFYASLCLGLHNTGQVLKCLLKEWILGLTLTSQEVKTSKRGNTTD